MRFKDTTLLQLTRIFNVLQGKFPAKEIKPQLYYLAPRNTDRPRILQMEVLNGSDQWSLNSKLILMKLQMNESHSSDNISGFTDRLVNVIPSLYRHNCTQTNIVGFVAGLRQGISIVHVIEHVAYELQVLAGMECEYNCIGATALKNENDVIVPYMNERAGKYAAMAALRLVNAIMYDESYDIENDIENLKKLKQKMVN